MPRLSDLAKTLNLPADWTVVGNRVASAVDDAGLPVPGQYTVVLSGPGGATRRVALTAQRTGNALPGFPYPAGYDPIPDMGDDVDFTVVDVEKQEAGTNAEETNARIAAAQASTAAANLQADRARLELEKTQREATEAQKNEAAGLGYRTNEQIEASNKIAADQGLNADQIAVQRAAMENNNRNTIASNQIAATNAVTGAQNAASTARATEARIKFEEGQLGLDEAKFEHQKSQDEIKQQNDTRDVTLKELTQQQQNQVQVEQNRLRGVEAAQTKETAEQTLEQRKAEMAQTAETAATTAATSAAANVYGTERQAQTAAGQTGAGLLNQRVSAGQGMLGQVLGLAGQRPMAGLAPGAGQAIMRDIQGFTTQLGGGQAVYDTAARLVQAADPQGGQSPQASLAYGVISQMLEKYQQQTGQKHPTVAATEAAQATAGGNGLTAPNTAPVPVAAGGAQPRTWQTPAETAQQSQARNGMLAPVTINIGGG